MVDKYWFIFFFSCCLVSLEQSLCTGFTGFWLICFNITNEMEEVPCLWPHTSPMIPYIMSHIKLNIVHHVQTLHPVLLQSLIFFSLIFFSFWIWGLILIVLLKVEYLDLLIMFIFHKCKYNVISHSIHIIFHRMPFPNLVWEVTFLLLATSVWHTVHF